MMCALAHNRHTQFYFTCITPLIKHMKRNNCFLIDLQPSSQDWVIFVNGGKRRVLGSGSLKILGLTKLKNVMLVKGLAVNLINVSQLCDEDLLLQFKKDKCIVYNRNHYRIMERERSSNNYHLLTIISSCKHESRLEQESLVQQLKHTRRSDTTITGPSSQIHLDLKAKLDQMSSL